jgi:hypothetical protein
MHRLLRRAPLACLIAMPVLPAAERTVADGAVIAALRRAAPAIANAAIIRRRPADDRLDLVLAIGSRQPQTVDAGGRYAWSLQTVSGCFYSPGPIRAACTG